MSYLHCHTKGCGWSQDDFYSKRYNPFTKIWSDIRFFWKPRMIEWDSMFARKEMPNIMKYTGVSIKIHVKQVFK